MDLNQGKRPVGGRSHLHVLVVQSGWVQMNDTYGNGCGGGDQNWDEIISILQENGVNNLSYENIHFAFVHWYILLKTFTRLVANDL
jgi:hypothetical protein